MDRFLAFWAGKKLLLGVIVFDLLAATALVVLLVINSAWSGLLPPGLLGAAPPPTQARAGSESPGRPTELPPTTRSNSDPTATDVDDATVTPTQTELGSKIATSTAVPSLTQTPLPPTATATSSSVPSTNTPKPPTATKAPTQTPTKQPTATNTSIPTSTDTPTITATSTPVPTSTLSPTPTLDPCAVVWFTVIQIWPGNSNFYIYNSQMQIVDITAVSYSWTAAGQLSQIDFNPEVLVTFSPAAASPIYVSSPEFNQRAPLGFGTRGLFFYFTGSGATTSHVLEVELNGICTITHSQ